LAATTDSASQLFERSTEIFPPGPPEPVDQFVTKKHPGYAQKSTEGRPSYYAQVGPKGTIEFIPTNYQE
jgi:hypothetical protein